MKSILKKCCVCIFNKEGRLKQRNQGIKENRGYQKSGWSHALKQTMVPGANAVHCIFGNKSLVEDKYLCSFYLSRTIFILKQQRFSSCNSNCVPHKAFKIFTIWPFIESLQISAVEKNSARLEQ